MLEFQLGIMALWSLYITLMVEMPLTRVLKIFYLTMIHILYTVNGSINVSQSDHFIEVQSSGSRCGFSA